MYLNKIYKDLEYKLENLELFADCIFIDSKYFDLESYEDSQSVDKYIYTTYGEDRTELCDAINSFKNFNDESSQNILLLLLYCTKHEKTRELKKLEF